MLLLLSAYKINTVFLGPNHTKETKKDYTKKKNQRRENEFSLT